jgi:hypothetical protein
LEIQVMHGAGDAGGVLAVVAGVVHAETVGDVSYVFCHRSSRLNVSLICEEEESSQKDVVVPGLFNVRYSRAVVWVAQPPLQAP